MNRLATFRNVLGAPAAIAGLALVVACSSSGSSDDTAGSGGTPGSGGGSPSGGRSAGGAPAGGSGNSQSGGTTSNAGSGAAPSTGGAGGAGPSMGGTMNATTGGAAGTTAGGGMAGTGMGAAGHGGGRCGASCGMGGAAGTLGTSGGSGGASAGAGGATAGAAGAGAGAGAGGSSAGQGGTGGTGGFDPCPATDPCKILPLGDSITWGINYGGGYRIKLFTHASTDKKNITFVGYDTANPPSSSVLSGLGSASSMWSPKHEGHSGWTIQQDDDLVTGKSTATNDSVNYTGKKVVADFNPNIVLVHLGTNDMHGTTAGAPDRLGTCIDHIVADAPNALVVVASIIPFPAAASATSTFNQAVPGVVKQRADAGKHVVYVDMFSALTTSDLGSDQVHPNEGGYEKMAVVWYTAIKSYLH